MHVRFLQALTKRLTELGVARPDTRGASRRAAAAAAAISRMETARPPSRVVDATFRAVKFVAGARAWRNVPPAKPDMQEVAVVGLSNVGKSSLVNALTRSRPARTSDKVVLGGAVVVFMWRS